MKEGWNIVRVVGELFGLGSFDDYYYYYNEDTSPLFCNITQINFFCNITQINFKNRLCLFDSLEYIGTGDLIDNINIL